MLLAVDIGNTNILCGGIVNGQIRHSFRMATHKDKSAAEYALQLNDLIRLYFKNPKELEGAIISSVVPEVTHSIEKAIIETLYLLPVIVKREIPAPFPIKLDYPATLGSDRIADATAVLHEYPLPAIIFDLGTANTMSVIDREGRFLGGAILAGLQLSLDALASGTSQLPHIQLSVPKKVVCSNTVECMQSGAVYGHAAMLDGLIDRVEEELGMPMASVVATGGLSTVVVPLCKRKIAVEEDLMLRGLKLIYDKNR